MKTLHVRGKRKPRFEINAAIEVKTSQETTVLGHVV